MRGVFATAVPVASGSQGLEFPVRRGGTLEHMQ
jgi:hypothetical protein